MPVGRIGWVDITVPDAPRLRDFYAAVVGWEAHEVPMEGYADFAMGPAGAESPSAGICHARGPNVGLPPAWLIYITVADLAASLEKATSLGGEVLHGPRTIEGGSFAVIRDPAGAVCALWEDAPGD